MKEYMGQADLLNANGEVIDTVDVYLIYKVDSGIPSWNGRINEHSGHG